MIIQYQLIIAFLVRAPRRRMRSASFSASRSFVPVSDQLFCNQWEKFEGVYTSRGPMHYDMNLDGTKYRDLSIPYVSIQTHGRQYDIQN